MSKIQVAILCLSAAMSIGSLFLSFLAFWRAMDMERIAADAVELIRKQVEREHREIRRVMGACQACGSTENVHDVTGLCPACMETIEINGQENE